MTTNCAESNHTPRRTQLRITSISKRPAVGVWVKGTLMRFTFEALVFRKHAVCPDYEIEQSRISKLFIRRQSDLAILYAWDRGLDIVAANAGAKRAVNILCARLASLVFKSEG